MLLQIQLIRSVMVRSDAKSAELQPEQPGYRFGGTAAYTARSASIDINESCALAQLFQVVVYAWTCDCIYTCACKVFCQNML